MKVILYMAISVNGFIAKENDDTSWVTENEWSGFSGMIRKNGNMIIGKRTYDVMVESDDFERSDLNQVKTIVLTKTASLKIHNSEFISVAHSPGEAINILRDQGFEIIMVCGGGGSNASFMKENLIDEIYLDIEPIVFGKGIKLFAESDFEGKLKLLETKKLSNDEIQLHYKVIKQNQ